MIDLFEDCSVDNTVRDKRLRLILKERQDKKYHVSIDKIKYDLDDLDFDECISYFKAEYSVAFHPCDQLFDEKDFDRHAVIKVRYDEVFTGDGYEDKITYDFHLISGEKIDPLKFINLEAKCVCYDLIKTSVMGYVDAYRHSLDKPDLTAIRLATLTVDRESIKWKDVSIIGCDPQIMLENLEGAGTFKGISIGDDGEGDIFDLEYIFTFKRKLIDYDGHIGSSIDLTFARKLHDDVYSVTKEIIETYVFGFRAGSDKSTPDSDSD